MKKSLVLLSGILMAATVVVAPVAPVVAGGPGEFRDYSPRWGPAASHQTSSVIGDQPWAVLLCRFSDKPDTPEPPAYFEDLFSDSSPGLGHYWNEVSLGKMSLAGTEVFGWYDMSRTYESFGLPGADGTSIPWDQVIDDCMNAADPYVRFPDYRGVAVMLNYRGPAAASIGSYPSTRDGTTNEYYTTVVPAPPSSPCSCPDDSSAWTHMGVVAHEMGHGMGFHHSSGPYAEVYDSGWDVMSDPKPVHTLAHNKAAAGWIRPSQVTTVLGGDTIITLLQPTETPTSGQMLAMVPGGSGSETLTVEVRKQVGWDTGLPGEGVIIHRVGAPGGNDGSTDAHVIDPDGNGDPDDEGAIWRPGETYSDPSGATVSVVSQEGDGFRVEIQNPLPDGTNNDVVADAVGVSGPGFTYRQSLEGATAATDDPTPGCVESPLTNTVWFTFSGTPDQEIVISIRGDNFSPTIAVYPDLQDKLCASPPPNQKGALRVETDRRDYRIMVGSPDGSIGTIELSLAERVDRSVTMKLTKHLRAAGTLTAGVTECASGQSVTIQKKTGSKWNRVTTVKTATNGSFVRKLPDKPGVYRASLRNFSVGNEYVCSAATSRTGTHRH